MSRITFACISVVLLMSASSSGAFAQAVSGSINGTVVDSSGAHVPNATVTITDLERGSKYTGHSTVDGNYEQTHLLAGRYEVRIESQGFAAFVANAAVQVDATTRVDA